MAQFINGLLWNSRNSSIHNIQRRHTSYVQFEGVESCYISKEREADQETACDFIQNSPSCNEMVNMVNYLHFLVCFGNVSATPWGLTELFVTFFSIVLFLVAFLLLLTKYFILPNVIHVAHYINMPLYDFGVTVIAVIVSGPQMAYITEKCNIFSKNGTLMMANMMGRIFTTFTVGLSVVCFGEQMKLPGKELVTHIIVSTIVLIITRRLVYMELSEESSALDFDAVALAFTIVYVCCLVGIILFKRRRDRRSSIHIAYHHHLPVVEISNGWAQLWHALNPFQHMAAPRFVIVIFTPFWLLAALHAPVIDKQRHMFGWCKYLTCLNMLVFPCIVYAHEGDATAYFVLACIFSLFVLIITIFCTKTDEPPKYHGFYAITGIFLGLYSYHVVQGELETILWQSFTFIFNVTPDIIMLTGYVFHNVLNLVIFCYELVVAGFGNLACGVVMGIVLNQIFLMLPIITFHECRDIQTLDSVSANTTTCFAFTILAFLVSIPCLSLTNFKLRICQGVFLITIYCIFLLFLVLSALSVIHPYGGFHSVALGGQKEYQLWA